MIYHELFDRLKQARTCRHDYTNDLAFCPYIEYDEYEQGTAIPTCCKCGKVKGQKIAYVGRRENGSRIILDLESGKEKPSEF